MRTIVRAASIPILAVLGVIEIVLVICSKMVKFTFLALMVPGWGLQHVIDKVRDEEWL